jgi:hypothetical protein
MTKNAILIAACFLGSQLISAQENSPETNPNSEKRRFSNQTHWNGFDLTVNWLGDANGNNANISPWLEQDLGKSIGFRFNFIEKKFPISKNGTGLMTGLGCGFESYAWKKNIELRYNDGTASDLLTYSYQPDNDFQKNKLQVSKLTVPLIMEFNFGSANKPQFHVAAGMLGNWKFDMMTKQSYHNKYGDFDVQNRTDFGIRRFSADFTASLGYGRTNFFVIIPTQTFFKNNISSSTYNFSAGFTILPFDSNDRIEKKKDELIKRWKI